MSLPKRTEFERYIEPFDSISGFGPELSLRISAHERHGR
jgi:hypothetical protein